MTNLKSFRTPKSEVRNISQIQGNGLFAKDDIKKGELVFIKAGHIVDHNTHVEIEKRLGEYCLQITHDYYSCPTTEEEVKDTAIYINHSCEPNVGPEGQISFYALRDIKLDEELVYDYAMTTDREYTLECNCGSKNCRRVITGDDWKRKDLQKKYASHFTYHILSKIKELKVAK